MADTFKENGVVRYWQIIVAATLIISAAAVNQFQTAALADEVKEIERKVEKIDEEEQLAKLKIVAIEKDVEATKNDVKEIKEEQKEQGKKLDRILEKLD